MAKSGKINTRSIVAHARQQILQARVETTVSSYKTIPSSLGAVKKVRVSKQDPTVRTLLELIN